VFPVIASSTTLIGILKNTIKVKKSNFLQRFECLEPHSLEGGLYHDIYVNVDVMNGLCWLITCAGRC
jgi:hypothetical protein